MLDATRDPGTRGAASAAEMEGSRVCWTLRVWYHVKWVYAAEASPVVSETVCPSGERGLRDEGSCAGIHCADSWRREAVTSAL